MKKWLAAITPCSVIQWLRVIFVLGLLIAMALGYTYGQSEFNVKVRPGTEALTFLRNPSQARLAPGHPLSKSTAQHALSSRTTLPQELDRLFTLQFSGNSAEQLRQELLASGDFEWVEPNRKVQLATASTDPEVSEQWYHPFVRTFEAWDITRGKPEVVIGILDTGLDYFHPEFAGQLAVKASEDANGNGRFDPWPASDTIDGVTGDFDGTDADGNGYVDDVIGYDFTDQPRSPFGGDYLFEDPNPYDDNDHGTLVAGIVGARGNNGLGGTGIAPGCRLKVLRAFAANGGGEDDDIARAIVYAADEGIPILNFSFGDIYPSQMMHEAIRYAESQGVVMVASAGNGTGDNLHYPSNFDEVIAVSATALGSDNSSEFLWPLSSFGWSVSLGAPGSGIYTTAVSDSGDVSERGFGTFSGTSTSAPMVAAAVGLLFSQRGICSPQQVRGMLTASADDVGSSGWDHFTGAGRLNIERLLAQVGGSNVQILSPGNDQGSDQNEVWVRGTVLDPEFQQWVLEYQPGLEGADDWIPVDSGEVQLQNDTLGQWDLENLPDGAYTLRLRVNKSNGATAEDRIRFVVDRSAPVVAVGTRALCWDNDEQKTLLVFRSDDRGSSQLEYRPLGGATWQSLAWDRGTRNGYFLLGADLTNQGPLEWRIRSVNAAGLEGVSPLDTLLPDFRVLPGTGFDTLGFDLPMGHFMATTLDLDADGLREVVMSEYNENLSFGRLKRYEYNGVQFSELDSLTFKPILIPKDVADTDGDNLLELLVSVNDSMYVMEQAAAGQFMTEEVARNLGNGLFPARFADPDQDGSVEVLAKDFVDYRVLSIAGGGLSTEATLPDQSPDYQGSVAPKALTADFDQDGRMEVVYGDFDGDLLIYEFNGSGYDLVFLDTTLLTKSGSYLAQGDFDADGVPEIAVAVHASLNRNEADFEYEAPFWQVRIFDATGNDQYEVVGTQYFFDIDTDGFNALTAGNVDADAADELVFSTFPRTYLLEWTNGDLTPTWFRYGDLTTHHLIEDFNGNGVKEIGIGLGDRTVFWEKDINAGGPDPVAYLEGKSTGATTASLRWQASPNASEYRIWRGELTGGPILISLVDSSSLTEIQDQNLVPGTLYLYLVESKNPSLNPVYSEFSPPLLLRPHAAGRLDSVVAVSNRQARACFSVPVDADEEDLPRFLLNGNQYPTSVIASGDNNRSLLLAFAEDFQASNVLQIDSNFLDLDRGMLDPAGRMAGFGFQAVEVDQAIFSRWEVRGPQEAEIWFDRPMTNSVLDEALYEVHPFGRVVRAEFAGTDQTAVRLQLEGVALGALGYPVSVVLTAGEAQDGALLSQKEGNVATFSDFQENLDAVFVYPNPYEGNDVFEGVRFANLPRQCRVEVYTASGRKVIELEESDGDGGLEWDLRNRAGERVSPGNYLFRVEDEEGETITGTFSLLR